MSSACIISQEYRWTEAERAAILAQPLMPEDAFTKEWQRLEALQQQVEAAGKRVNRKVAAPPHCLAQLRTPPARPLPKRQLLCKAAACP
jgi:hypothetical protein